MKSVNEMSQIKSNILIFKILLTIILTLIISSNNYAQKVFDKFEVQDEVSSVVVDKKMFELMSKVKVDASNIEMQKYLDVIKNLEKLQAFVTSNHKIKMDMKLTFDNYVKTGNFEELMNANENGKNTKILIKPSAQSPMVNELLMFTDGSSAQETVLLSITGEFNLNEIYRLTDKMNIPGSDKIKKISKK
jgi:ribosomal protein S18